MKRLLGWLVGLFKFGRRGKGAVPNVLPPAKSVVTLVIYPTRTEDVRLGEIKAVGTNRYYVSAPWEMDFNRLNGVVRMAEDWLAGVVGRRLLWNSVRVVNSRRSLAEWRSQNISLIRGEVQLLGLPWTDDYIYLALVRGTGGYAGGIRAENGNAGYAMVGDICLEAVCEYPEPTAGSVLLGSNGWPPNSYSRLGQIAAFVHESLHGADLPHPDGWPEVDRPGWDETVMGHWWNMPNFLNTNGLTQREIERVLRWMGTM